MHLSLYVHQVYKLYLCACVLRAALLILTRHLKSQRPYGGARSVMLTFLFSTGIKLACCHAQVLQKICWFVVLAATSSDQVTLLSTTAADKKLEALPIYKELLQTFITQEASPHCPLASLMDSTAVAYICFILACSSFPTCIGC